MRWARRARARAPARAWRARRGRRARSRRPPRGERPSVSTPSTTTFAQATRLRSFLSGEMSHRRRHRLRSRPANGGDQGGGMNDLTSESEPAFHLFLDADELPVAASALRLLISDEAHQPDIRRLAREVLAAVDAAHAEQRAVRLPLSPSQMKITYTAVRLLLNDLQREQDDERQILWRIVEKLPDEE